MLAHCGLVRRLSRTAKRKYLELQSSASVCQQLFDILQNKPPMEGEEILRHIQSGADAETVLTRVRDGDMLLRLSLRASAGPIQGCADPEATPK